MKRNFITTAVLAIAMTAGGISVSAQNNVDKVCGDNVCSVANAEGSCKKEDAKKNCPGKDHSDKCKGKKGCGKKNFGKKNNEKPLTFDKKRDAEKLQMRNAGAEKFASALEGINLTEEQKSKISEVEKKAGEGKHMSRQERLESYKKILTTEQYMIFLENLASAKHPAKGKYKMK